MAGSGGGLGCMLVGGNLCRGQLSQHRHGLVIVWYCLGQILTANLMFEQCTLPRRQNVNELSAKQDESVPDTLQPCRLNGKHRVEAEPMYRNISSHKNFMNESVTWEKAALILIMFL